MSAVTPVSSSVYGFETAAGPQPAQKLAGGEGRVESCLFACGFTGVYAQGTGYSISLATITAAIATAKRDGSTFTVLDVMPEGPGLEGGAFGGGGATGASAGFVMPGPATVGGPTAGGLNTAGATGLLYGPDLLTEHGATTMQPFTAPCVFRVSFCSQAAI